MKLCPKCGYPISEMVQFLMAAGIRPKPNPNAFICECGITDREQCLMGESDPTALIKLMKEKGFSDWDYMIYKLTDCQTIDLLEGADQ